MKYFTKSQEQDIIMKPVICGNYSPVILYTAL